MPSRQVRALAYYHPGPRHADAGLPTREMWVGRVPNGIAALATHPVFQLAPLNDSIRAQMLLPDRQKRILKEVRFAREGAIEALIWSPCYWNREERFLLVDPLEALYDPYRPQDFNNRFSPYDHWIGMTRDRVWRTGGGARDHIVLGAYVHLLERLDLHGNPLPVELQGPIWDCPVFVDGSGGLAEQGLDRQF
ncbi:hypothetical protein [Methylorubrum aminovorans]|uniref:hypothetical protein n=1 Tax=Methylorubrum aminovorans TaxID=269069 RepID=UPI001EDCAC09|nr:hypothetical protein [Methylorubrum aminovorans]GMA74805.1 hypothetical protein GCM10025880_12220 [Methylorubrum aminovorans]